MQPIHGTQCIQPTRHNPLCIHGIGTFMVLDAANLWYSIHPTNSIQPSVLPRHRNLYGTRCSQPAQDNPPCFHGVKTISTLLWCRNYSTLPRHRNLFWYLMKPTSLVQPSALPWRWNLLWYTMQPISSEQPFASTTYDAFHTSAVYELLHASMA